MPLTPTPRETTDHVVLILTLNEARMIAEHMVIPQALGPCAPARRAIMSVKRKANAALHGAERDGWRFADARAMQGHIHDYIIERQS